MSKPECEPRAFLQPIPLGSWALLCCDGDDGSAQLLRCRRDAGLVDEVLMSDLRKA